MAYEPSEILFAAASTLGPTGVKALLTKVNTPIPSKSKKTKEDIIEEIHTKVIVPAIDKVIFATGKPAKKNGQQSVDPGVAFKKKIDITGKAPDARRKILEDTVRAISAAAAQFKNLPYTKSPDAVYMTGNSWPGPIEKFRITLYEFSDYNSTDIMLQYNGVKPLSGTGKTNMFIGISLKKKNTSSGADPTLINKAFDTAFYDPKNKSFNKLKQDLENAKISSLANIVIKAVNQGHIAYTDINRSPGVKIKKGKDEGKSEFNKWAETDAGRDELYEGDYIDQNIFKKSSSESGHARYINVKGWPGNYNDLTNKELNDDRSTRKFVNGELSNIKHPLWQNYVSIIKKHSSFLGQTLISIILRTDLEDAIDKQHLKGTQFAFYLTTGVGQINTKGDVSGLNDGKCISLKTILCGIDRIMNNNNWSNNDYNVTLNDVKNKESGAAKIFLTLSIGKYDILDMEVRFKGDFTQQPQYQAFISDNFAREIKRECE